MPSSSKQQIIPQLPNELLLKIIQYLPANDVLLSAVNVSTRWRSLISANLSRIQRIPAHCRVIVLDIDLLPDNDCGDGRSPVMEYYFATYNTPESGYPYFHGIDNQLRSIYIQHRRSCMSAKWEVRGQFQSLDNTTAARLLSYLDVVALRVDALKKGPHLVAKRIDERLAHAITFCEEMCGNVDLKSLILRSQNPYFTWCLGEESLKRLSSFRNLECLLLENMIDHEALDSIKEAVDLGKLKCIKMRVDASGQYGDEIMLLDHVQEQLNRATHSNFLSGSLLASLAAAHVDYLDFSAFPGMLVAVIGITASDICNFINLWRALPVPWMIKWIQFNSVTTFNEFRAVARRQGLLADMYIETRNRGFLVYHPSHRSVALVLSFFENQTSTQWCIHSGFH